MNEWAFKRKAIFVTAVIVVLSVVVTVPIFLTLSQPNEELSAPPREPHILWSRAVETTDGIYNAVARARSPHEDLMAARAEYLFRFYNEAGRQIGQRSGATVVPGESSFLIFEDRIQAEGRVTYVTFEWRSVSWEPGLGPEDPFSVHDVEFRPEDEPRLNARIRNNSFSSIASVEVVAQVFDRESGDLRGLSRTAVNSLSGESEVPVSFTWPEGFERGEYVVEVTPRAVR